MGESEDYRASAFVVHPSHGMILLYCRNRKSGNYYQLCGGPIDETEFIAAAEETIVPKSQRLLAAKKAVAEALFVEIGLDFRKQLDRLSPAHLHPKDSADAHSKPILSNEYQNELYFTVTVSDEDFGFAGSIQDSKHIGLVKPMTASGSDLSLKLSNKYQGWRFESDTEQATKMLPKSLPLLMAKPLEQVHVHVQEQENEWQLEKPEVAMGEAKEERLSNVVPVVVGAGATAAATAPITTTNRHKFGLWLSSFLKEYFPHVPPFWEVVFRMTLSAFCGSALAVWAPSSIVPQANTDVLAMATLTFVGMAPPMVFGIGAALAMIAVDMIWGLVCATMLLSAFTVSDGLGVAMMTVLTLLLSTFSFKGMIMGLLAEFGLCLGSLMAVSYRELVQDGLSFTIDEALTEGGGILELAREVLSTLCLDQGQPEDCWIGSVPKVNEPIEIPIQSGNFAGQTATITPNIEDSSVTISVEGGLYIVAGLWAWSGMDNSLAGLRNFMIAWLWGLACIIPGILCPPVRTIRKALSRGVIPAVIKDVTTLVRSHLDEMPKEERVQVSVGGADMEKSVLAKGDREELVGRLVNYGVMFAGGNLARTTSLEPRLLRAPFECSWKNLQELMCSIHYLILTTLAVGDVWYKGKDFETVRAFYLTLGKADGILDRCTSALHVNADPVLDPGMLSSIELASDAVLFKDRINDVLTATTSWLNAMHHPDRPLPWTKKGLQNIAGTYLSFLAVPISLFKGLYHAFLWPFRPHQWDAKMCIWLAKWTIGWVALTCMEVYWDAYINFGIKTGQDGSSAGLFSGWNLLAYGFTWVLTVEGTVKKGLMRVSGTAAGCFAAWLGVIVCSWSYDDFPDINPYGLVAWLTAMSFLNVFFTVDHGPKAFMGKSTDYGFHGLYFGLTLSMCAMEIYRGVGSRDDIVANRLVTTLTGCGVAIFLAVLPPYYWGNEPELARNVLAVEKSAVADCLRILVSEKEDTASELQKALNAFDSRYTETYGTAKARLSEATGLKLLPILQVDPALATLHKRLAVTASEVRSCLDMAVKHAEEEAFLAQFVPGGRVHHVVRHYVKELVEEEEADDAPGPTQEPSDEPTQELGYKHGKELSDVEAAAPFRLEIGLFMVFTRRMMTRFRNYDSTLSGMEESHWSPLSKRNDTSVDEESEDSFDAESEDDFPAESEDYSHVELDALSLSEDEQSA